jgi:hypothetical protein
VEGFARLEHKSFDVYNKGGNLQGIIERYRQREGHCPERILVDGIYRNRENITFCKKHGIRFMGKPLGRPKKYAVIYKKQMRSDEISRVEAERKLSHVKGSFGLRLVRTKLKVTSESSITLAIVAMNLHNKWRVYRTNFYCLLDWLSELKRFRKTAIVQ